MKTLKLTLENSISLQDFIDITNIDEMSIVEQHFFLDFEIYKSISFENERYSINEKYGVYDGQIEFIEVLVQNLINIFNEDKSHDLNLNKEDLEDFEHIFFNKLSLKISDDGKFSYIAQDNFNEETQSFDEVIIYVNPYAHYKELFRGLTHELTHAWHDYTSYIKNSTSLFDISLDRKVIAHKLLKKLSSNQYNKLAKDIHYFLMNHERSAYLSEIFGHLKTELPNINTYKDAIKVFKGTSVYKSLDFMYSAINQMNNDDSSNKQLFIETYNLLSNKKYTWDKLYKKLKKDLENAFEKISINASKIYCDYVTSEKNIREELITYESFSNIRILNFSKI